MNATQKQKVKCTEDEESGRREPPRQSVKTTIMSAVQAQKVRHAEKKTANKNHHGKSAKTTNNNMRAAQTRKATDAN